MLNTQYNKAVYGGLATALTTIVLYVASLYGVAIPVEVQTAVTTIITAFIVWLIPNKQVA